MRTTRLTSIHPPAPSDYPLRHSHNPHWILQAWKKIALQARLQWTVIHHVDGFPVVALKQARSNEPLWYFSSGVHGDEPGAALGLLHWARHQVEWLRTHPCLIFPLFNPVGFSLNQRDNGHGIDLNRHFHNRELAHIAAWQDFIQGNVIKQALCLHEDYDAEGIYCYELGLSTRKHTSSVPSVGSRMLESASHLIPHDPRTKIDGQKFREGLFIRKKLPLRHDVPEALYLRQHFNATTLTFETPSELDLTRRIQAQAIAIESSLISESCYAPEHPVSS